MNCNIVQRSSHKCYASTSYGEKGYAVLHLLLLKLFRPRFIANPSLVHELDADTFISKILVPKLATELIREDRQCTTAEAIETLFRSAKFGKDAFPLEDEDDMDFAAEVAERLAKDYAASLDMLKNASQCVQCGTGTHHVPSRGHPPRPRPVKKNPRDSATPSASQPSTSKGSTAVSGHEIKQEEVEGVIPPAGSSYSASWEGFKLVRVTDDGKPCYELLSDEDK